MHLRLNQSKNLNLSLTILFVGLFLIVCSSPILAKSITSLPMIQSLGSNSTQASTSNSFVALDFSLQSADFWDAKDDSNNMIAQCIDGTTITGFEYSNITLQTVGGSYFSEAVMYFSDSNRADDGLKLRLGAGNESSGTITLNSNGIFDITDSGNMDINSLVDNHFVIQFFEEVDDEADAIDARFTNGILKVWGVDLVAVDCPFIDNVITAPDLSVSYTTTQTTNTVGEAIDFNININNTGTNTAQNVQIQTAISENLTLLEFSCNDGSNTATFSQNTELNVQNIEINSTLDCLIKSEINSVNDDILFDVSVSTDSEINTSNNSASFVVRLGSIVVPINNVYALLFLALLMFFVVKKRNIPQLNK